MLIAIDGACKRNGEPDCFSTGVAWFITDTGDMFFKAACETQSTSQRGELSGLLEALKYAAENAAEDEDVIIVTDSEYMFNSVDKEWCIKWRAANWIGGQGLTVKNADMWEKATSYIDQLKGQLFMQWTKGHMVHYTPGNIKKAMSVDPSGIELYNRICATANRPADKDRIINDFINNRVKHGHIAPPRELSLEWAICNAQADALASYLVKTMDDSVYALS